jgi:hypothetical protein
MQTAAQKLPGQIGGKAGWDVISDRKVDAHQNIRRTRRGIPAKGRNQRREQVHRKMFRAQEVKCESATKRN